jgi:hypothetical protein
MRLSKVTQESIAMMGESTHRSIAEDVLSRHNKGAVLIRIEFVDRETPILQTEAGQHPRHALMGDIQHQAQIAKRVNMVTQVSMALASFLALQTPRLAPVQRPIPSRWPWDSAISSRQQRNHFVE